MKKTTKLTLALLVAASCAVDTQTFSQEEATKFMRENYQGQWRMVTCMNLDNDGDGYASCTAVMNDSRAVSLECAAQSRFACVQLRGCRLQRMQTNNMMAGDRQ